MKFSKFIFHIKPIPSHPWWECKNRPKICSYKCNHKINMRACIFFLSRRLPIDFSPFLRKILNKHKRQSLGNFINFNFRRLTFDRFHLSGKDTTIKRNASQDFWVKFLRLPIENCSTPSNVRDEGNLHRKHPEMWKARGTHAESTSNCVRQGETFRIH